MNDTAARLLGRFFLLMLAASVALAQTAPPPPYPQAQPAFSQRELDQMLAPIALYPDPLLAQILMASTYPLEVVEAARWSKANPGYRGEHAVRAVASQNWDPSVKSLVAFPQILALMDERLAWTERLGEAFLAQEQQLMDTVQLLRQRAYEAGNLRSNEQMLVSDEGGVIALSPVDPQVVYVPYYDPLLVYGTWWWPASPPVHWAAWPGYRARPGFTPGFWWGVGVAVSVGFFFGAFDWHRRHVRVVRVDNYYYRGARVRAAPGRWEHEAQHRRGVPYRNERLRSQYSRSSGSSAPGARREFRGYEAPPTGSRLAPGVSSPFVKPESGGRAPSPPVQAPAPASRAAAPKAAPQRAVPESSPGAFEGIRRGGPQTRAFSARGQGSLQQRDPGPRPTQQNVAPGGAAVPQGRAAPGGGHAGSKQRRSE